MEQSTWILPNSEISSLNTYLPNSYIFVNDTLNNKSGYYIIRTVIWEQPGNFKITVGTPMEDIVFWQKEVQQKVKQLEEKDDNSTILNEDEFVEENLLIEFDVDIIDIKKEFMMLTNIIGVTVLQVEINGLQLELELYLET